MGWKLLGKVLVLVAISVTTSVVTSEVLARSGRTKKKRNITAEAAVAGVRQQRAVFPASGYTSVESLNVEPLGNSIHVWGRAVVHDTRPGVNYVWSVRVRDLASNKQVAENRYDHQVFQPQQDINFSTPRFEDNLNVPLLPGVYKVELVLYEVPPEGLAVLNNPTMSEHHLMAKRSARISVGR